MTIIKIPNIGTDEAVEVIEVLIAKGDKVDKEQALVVLESDKASMEVPCPQAGEIIEVKVKVGDKVKEGSEVAELNASDAAPAPAETSAPAPAETSAPAPAETSAPAPAPAETSVPAEAPAPAPAETSTPTPAEAPTSAAGVSTAMPDKHVEYEPTKLPAPMDDYYAGPAVRKMARELGADLNQVTGSGANGRILKEDVQQYIKQRLSGAATTSSIAAAPVVDFAAFGKVEELPMDKIKSLTADNMQRAWLTAPHVTQFEDADVTDLENFRKMQKSLAEQKNIKLTPIPFLLKALALTLQELPQFNVSLRGNTIIQKHYYHIGMAVDTPAGLMVPVIKDVDKKNIWELAAEVSSIVDRARNRRITANDMKGGCITLSSLGAAGGRQFTPIINIPEVAILGVSRVNKVPVYQGEHLVPRLMMPLALSYDHRAVNGVDGAKFTSYISNLLGDIRNLAM